MKVQSMQLIDEYVREVNFNPVCGILGHAKLLISCFINPAGLEQEKKESHYRYVYLMSYVPQRCCIVSPAEHRPKIGNVHKNELRDIHN